MVRSFVRKYCISRSVADPDPYQKCHGSAILVIRYLKKALQVCAVPAALGEEAGAQRANDGLLGGQEA
jgi:hypothetical protein